ncbi:MAG: response regulator transcription factor [bacterium]
MTSILVVDDHPSLRSEIVRLVVAGDDLAVIGEADSGEDAVEKARRLTPDLVLMDIVLPRMNGAEATRLILKERPETLILVLSNYSNAGLVRNLLDAGARGYVRKDHAFEELLEAIDAVVSGRRYIGSGIDADAVT